MQFPNVSGIGPYLGRSGINSWRGRWQGGRRHPAEPGPSIKLGMDHHPRGLSLRLEDEILKIIL